LAIPIGSRLVLPSPNGSTLSLSSGDTPTFAGCLRNAKAVAKAASRCGPRIAVIPSGERWREDFSLRPAFEDLVGAGAIISQLAGTLSPEAGAALAAFHSSADALVTRLKQCSSGKELISKGSVVDINLIGQLDVDKVAPLLIDGAYVGQEVSGTD
jgi:2-phosphosulfolactate phosphatase